MHIYGTTGRISIGIPFNIPPDRPTEVYLSAGGDPPVAPDTRVLTFEVADPYTVEAERFAAAVLDGQPAPLPPNDAVANLRVIERIFEAAEAATRDPRPSWADRGRRRPAGRRAWGAWPPWRASGQAAAALPAPHYLEEAATAGLVARV